MKKEKKTKRNLFCVAASDTWFKPRPDGQPTSRTVRVFWPLVYNITKLVRFVIKNNAPYEHPETYSTYTTAVIYRQIML